MIRIILAVVFVILVATFSTLNREEISLRYFFGWATEPFPLFLLVLACLVIGLVLGFSVDWAASWKLKSKARGLRKQMKKLQKEIESLTAARTHPEPASSPPEAQKTTAE